MQHSIGSVGEISRCMYFFLGPSSSSEVIFRVDSRFKIFEACRFLRHVLLVLKERGASLIYHTDGWNLDVRGITLRMGDARTGYAP